MPEGDHILGELALHRKSSARVDKVQDAQLSIKFRQTANNFHCKDVPNIALVLCFGFGLFIRQC